MNPATFPLDTPIGPLVCRVAYWIGEKSERTTRLVYIVESREKTAEECARFSDFGRYYPVTVRGRLLAGLNGLVLGRGPCPECVAPQEFARREKAGEWPANPASGARRDAEAAGLVPAVRRMDEAGPCPHEPKGSLRASVKWHTVASRDPSFRERYTSAAALTILATVTAALDALPADIVAKAEAFARLTARVEAREAAAAERKRLREALAAAEGTYHIAASAADLAATQARIVGVTLEGEAD